MNVHPGIWFAVAVVAVVFGLRYVMASRSMAPLGHLMDGGEFRQSGFPFESHVRGRFNGRDAFLLYTPLGPYTPRSFVIELACRAPWQFHLRARANTASAGSRLPAAATGDPALDERLAAGSDSAPRLARWLAEPLVRGEIESLLLSGGYVEIELRDSPNLKEKALGIFFFRRVPALDPQTVRRLVERLEALAKAVEAAG